MSKVYRVGYKSNKGIVFSQTAEIVGDSANDYMDVALCKNDVIDNNGQRYIVGENDMWLPFHTVSPYRKRIVTVKHADALEAERRELADHAATMDAASNRYGW